MKKNKNDIPWEKEVSWKYIRRSEDVQNVIWVLYPGG